MLDTHTFVIAAHKESEFLEDCIKSVFRQTVHSSILMAAAEKNKHIERLAKKYNIPLFINENGGTIGKDWNYCLEIAETPYVTIAHQDDVYLSDYTAGMLQAFKENPEAAIAFSSYHEIRNGRVVADNINLIIKKLLLEPFKLTKNRFTQKIPILFGSALCCPSVTYNKEALVDFTFDETLSSDLDWKAWIELYESGYEFCYIPKVLMLHRIHAQSETSRIINDKERREEDLSVLKMLWPDKIAGGIEHLYQLSEKANTLEEEK